MPDFIYLIHPLREGFFEKPTTREEQTMEAHFNYLKHAADSGTVILAGPCLDDTFGIVILQAQDFEEAQKFMFNDPSVMNNVMMAEIHPFRISLLSQNEHSLKTEE